MAVSPLPQCFALQSPQSPTATQSAPSVTFVTPPPPKSFAIQPLTSFAKQNPLPPKGEDLLLGRFFVCAFLFEAAVNDIDNYILLGGGHLVI